MLPPYPHENQKHYCIEPGKHVLTHQIEHYTYLSEPFSKDYRQYFSGLELSEIKDLINW